MAGIIISLDAFGPSLTTPVAPVMTICRRKWVRHCELDAVGNIHESGDQRLRDRLCRLAALVLFGSYVEELRAHVIARVERFDSNSGYEQR